MIEKNIHLASTGTGEDSVAKDMLQILRVNIEELPSNQRYYALIYASSAPATCQLLVESLQQSFTENLVAGKWRRLKNNLRFLGELTYFGVISKTDLVSVYTSLLSVVYDAFSRLERKDVFVSTVLHALSWSGSVVEGGADANLLGSVMTTIQDYIQSHRQDRSKASLICKTLNSPPSADFPQLDALELLYQQVKLCRDANWAGQSHIQRLPVPAAVQPSQVPFGPIKVPLERPGIEYPLPYAHFEVFHSSILSAKGVRQSLLLSNLSLFLTEF